MNPYLREKKNISIMYMSKTEKNISFSKNESHWLNLVKDIYNNRHSCPHRQSLAKILKDASKLYCPTTDELKDTPRMEHTPSRGFTGKESGWLHLVKNILRNSKCKYHGDLKVVLKKASKVYCKPKKTTSRKKTIKATKPKTILQTIGLA
jgi:hypothetical protein